MFHIRSKSFIKRVKPKSSKNPKLYFTKKQFRLLQAFLNINNVNPVNISKSVNVVSSCAMLIQRFFNVAECRFKIAFKWYLLISTLFQNSLNFCYSYFETNLVSGKHKVEDRLRNFALQKEKIFVTIF